MQNLRFVERRDQELVFETDSGAEFRFEVDDEFIDAVRAVGRARPSRASTRVSPRQIQSLLRAGTPRDAVAQQLGVETADIERYEGPILAEFQHMISQAHRVPVRTLPQDEDEPQSFGQVIEERLDQLHARDRAWSAWRDEEDGWMVQVEFDSHGSLHTAIWAFDHRKSLLSPVTPDAVNLSKQGDVGDKLIPTLRVVDRVDEQARFDADAFDDLADEVDDDASAESDSATDDAVSEHPFVSTNESDFLRRQEIEQRAIATERTPEEDLGQTADLLDALRRRRFDREGDHDATTAEPAPLPPAEEEPQDAQPKETLAEPERPARKGRASIPSWDDILFGTRSDDD